MIRRRPSEARGHFDHGWLETRHTFSFDRYYDPAHMGFRSLRVMNEDVIRPGGGFGTHGHRDMEILTIVLEGALEHRDSTGHVQILRPGEVQRMTAGTGILHSEANASRSEPVHLYQIWILPERRGLRPEYEKRAFPESPRRGRLRPVAAPDGREGSLRIHQDAVVYVARLEAGERLAHAPSPGRGIWVQALRGAFALNGQPLGAGDGAAAEGEARLEIAAESPSELLLFDLA